jgi:hypothetical protein
VHTKRQNTDRIDTPPELVSVSDNDVKLYFRNESGQLIRFEGSQKITDLIESGLWNQNCITSERKTIYFIVDSNQAAPPALAQRLGQLSVRERHQDQN